MEATTSDYDKEKLQERFSAVLSCWVAVLLVEVEKKKRKD
jgi:hypothetical protein